VTDHREIMNSTAPHHPLPFKGGRTLTICMHVGYDPEGDMT